MMQSKKRTWVFLVPLVMFGLMMVMFFLRLGKPSDVAITTSMNRALPAFELPLLTDLTRTMTNAELPKKPFLLNVWGSWCPTCKVEHPFLMKLHAQGVPMVGINYKDDLADALAYLNNHQDPFLYSIQDLQGSYALDLGLTGAPETFVVDGQGVVYKHIAGEIHEKNWSEQILPCMQAIGDSTLEESVKIKACQ